MEPHLLKAIVDNDGNTIYEYQSSSSEQIIDSEVSATISQILKEGVDGEGGAKNAYVAGYSIAAKTGTSEKKDKYDEQGNTSYRVSSCIAYGPSENAEVAVIILVDEPTIGSKYGSVVAAPYVSNLMEAILPYLGVEPVYNENDLEHQEVTVPNITEKTLEEAIKELKALGVQYEIIGDGETVLSQMPISNSKIYKKSGKVLVYTSFDKETHTKMPNVIGKTAEEANQIILNSGLNIKINGATNYTYGESAVVVEQYPAPETSIKKGTIAEIKILFLDEDD